MRWIQRWMNISEGHRPVCFVQATCPDREIQVFLADLGLEVVAYIIQPKYTNRQHHRQLNTGPIEGLSSWRPSDICHPQTANIKTTLHSDYHNKNKSQ